MVVSSCKFMSNLFFKSHPIVIRMDDITFLATWDDDTSNVGIINLTKVELKEFTTGTGSDNGEHSYHFNVKKTPFSLVSRIRRTVRSQTGNTDGNG